ncbi:hypothetical protein V5799_029350, partial [Amblyomma americanum]
MSLSAPDFAYVRYKDNISCAVVPVTDVKDFAPENAQDFDSRICHHVKWTDAEGEADFYPARIFVLGGSSQKKWSLPARSCNKI